MFSKEREIFQNIYNENLDKIEQLTNKTNYDYLKYVSESSGTETVFYAKKKYHLVFLNDIKTTKITIDEAKDSQEDFNKYLKMIRKGKKCKTKKNYVKY